MVALQSFHLGDALRNPNISTCMRLKLFCSWCLKLGRNTETITTLLWEVHYQMVIVCNICWALAGMSAQNVLDHWRGCKKMATRSTWVERAQKVPKVPQEKEVQVTGTKESIWVAWVRRCQEVMLSQMSPYVVPLLPSPSSECTLVQSLDHSGSLWIFWASPCSVRWTASSFLLVMVVVINDVCVMHSLTILSYTLILSKLWMLKNLINICTFIQSFVLCVKSCSGVGELNWPNTLVLGSCWIGVNGTCLPPNCLDQHDLVPARCSKFVFRAGLILSGKVMMAWNPLLGDIRSSHSIIIEDEAVTQKLMHSLALPFHTPPKLQAFNF